MGATKVLVIGGGFGGCASAHVLSEKTGFNVTLIEQASYLGGGCKTHLYGGHPFTYGPRHFLTKEKRLFDFLNKYVPMRSIAEHEFYTYVERDGNFYNYPIHADDIPRMPDADKVYEELENKAGVENAKNFEDYWIGSVGPTLYSKFVDDYSKKMWQLESNKELDTFDWSPKGVALKTGPREAWTEAISAYPIKLNGYDDYFDIATEKTQVRLNTRIEDFDIENKRVKVKGEWESYDIIINTISPEIILKGAFGPLRWVGRDFHLIVLPVKEVLPPNMYFLYYANKEPFTRLVEYKKFYKYDSPSTLLGLEIPSKSNKLYPMPIKKDQELAQKYFDAFPKGVYSMGRAGKYRYIDVDDIIADALELAETV